MKHAQKPDHVNLGTLLQRIREGQYVIPDFQREFEWSPSDIRELMASIFQDYFIGSEAAPEFPGQDLTLM